MRYLLDVLAYLLLVGSKPIPFIMAGMIAAFAIHMAEREGVLVGTAITAVSDAAFPVRFRWYRAAPLDAAMTLPGGRTVGILRQGHTADRSGFAKRLWRLREGLVPPPRP